MSFSRWMDKLWYIQKMEYFSALRRNDLSSHEKIMRNLKSTLLGERNQSEKTTYYMIPTIWHLKRQNYGDSIRISGRQRWEGKEGWVTRAQRNFAAAAAAKSLQSCPTLCNPIDGSPPGSSVPGILQARTLEWVAVSFSNVWKWEVKVKSLSCVRLLATPWTAAHQAPPSMGFSRQEYWSGVPLPSPREILGRWKYFAWYYNIVCVYPYTYIYLFNSQIHNTNSEV